MLHFALRRWQLAAVFLITACRAPTQPPQPVEPPPAALAPAAPATPVFPTPFEGPVETKRGSLLSLPLRAQMQVSATHTVLVYELPEDWKRESFALVKNDQDPATFLPSAEIHVEGSEIQFAFISNQDIRATAAEGSPVKDAPEDRLLAGEWLWVLTANPAKVQDARLFTAFEDYDQLNVWRPTERPLVLQLPRKQDEVTLLQLADWGRALGHHLGESRRETAFERFANRRLSELYDPQIEPSNQDWMEQRAERGLGDLLAFSSGWESIDAALQPYRQAKVKKEEFSPTLPIRELRSPELRRHDWKTMLQSVAAQKDSPPIFAAAPADFYVIHGHQLSHLERLLKEVELYLEPVAQLYPTQAEVKGLIPRYRRKLGLPEASQPAERSKAFVDELILVGSDPFLAQGSDVTLVIRPTPGRRTLLRKMLDAALALRLGDETPHTARIEIAGQQVESTASTDHSIHRLIAEVGPYLLLSNSENALASVFDTLAKKRPALKDELDFQYMWRRDAESTPDIFFYASDRFIEANLSPERRITDARRALAEYELIEQGHAFLLSALLHGKMAENREQLIEQKLLSPAQINHFDGSPIVGNHDPRSSWGRTQDLTPLIDRPTPTVVTAEEKAAYEVFVERYERDWGEFFDPIALRFKFPEDAELQADVRILPVFAQQEMRELEGLTGPTRISRVESPRGMSAALALKPQENSWLRQWAGQELDAMDWLGDYVLIGMDDNVDVARTLFRYAPEPKNEANELSPENELAQLPLYAILDIKNRSSFSLFLAGLTLRMADTGQFGEVTSETVDDVTIQTLPVQGTPLLLHYALGKEAFFLSTQKATLLRLLKHETSAGFAQKDEKNGAQIFWGANFRSPSSSSALLLVSQWLFETMARTEFSSLMQGRHRDAAYFAAALEIPDGETIDTVQLRRLVGKIPRTMDGLTLRQSVYGALDPARGNRLHPDYAAIPFSGSWIDKIFQNLQSAEFDLAFDKEAPGADQELQRSFHSRMTIRRARKH
ncbi:MAG: hypothetical protein MK135_03555 [Polyangiaceae bacterium]|nr:hypothetical protein [Polyangiaceae bacterium]